MKPLWAYFPFADCRKEALLSRSAALRRYVLGYGVIKCVKTTHFTTPRKGEKGAFNPSAQRSTVAAVAGEFGGDMPTCMPCMRRCGIRPDTAKNRAEEIGPKRAGIELSLSLYSMQTIYSRLRSRQDPFPIQDLCGWNLGVHLGVHLVCTLSLLDSLPPSSPHVIQPALLWIVEKQAFWEPQKWVILALVQTKSR